MIAEEMNHSLTDGASVNLQPFWGAQFIESLRIIFIFLKIYFKWVPCRANSYPEMKT